MDKYDKYKDSGFDWIGEIPEHWEFEKLGWQGNFSSSGIDKKTVKGEPLIKIINYTDVYGNENLSLSADKKYMVVSCPETKKKIHQVNVGDLIFTPSSETIDEIGLSALVVDELPETAYSYHVIRLRFNKDFDIAFRKYLCNNNFALNQFSREAKGTTRQIIGRDVFKNIGVVIPPKEEQTAIATYLDHKTAEIDELISKKEQLLKLYEEEKTAIINQAVTKGLNHDYQGLKDDHDFETNKKSSNQDNQTNQGSRQFKDSGIDWLGEIPEHWEVKKLKYVGKIKYGLGQPPKLKYNGLPLIRATNVLRGRIDEKDLIFVDPDDIPYDRDPVLKEFDIIVVRSGAYTADSAIIPQKYEGAITGYDMVFRSNCNFNPKFISSVLLSRYVLNSQLIPQSLRAAQPHLNREELGETLVLIPPLEEQTAIVHHIETEINRINAKAEKTKKLIELLGEYKQSLISEVVTGKIKVLNRDFKD